MKTAAKTFQESRYYLILTEDLGYGDVSRIKPLIEEVSKLLDAYMHSILNSDS